MGHYFLDIQYCLQGFMPETEAGRQNLLDFVMEVLLMFKAGLHVKCENLGFCVFSLYILDSECLTLSLSLFLFCLSLWISTSTCVTGPRLPVSLSLSLALPLSDSVSVSFSLFQPDKWLMNKPGARRT